MKNKFRLKAKLLFLLFSISLASMQYKAFTQFPNPYCDATFPFDVHPITLVEFEGINNTSSDTLNASSALEDFTYAFAQVLAGQDYPITVKGNTDGSAWSPAKVVVFIDWNQNFSFDDPGERYELSDLVNSDGLDNIVSEGIISVPSDALTGYTRMRVMKKFQSYPIACNGIGTGQAEDYTVAVYSSACSGMPNAGVIKSTEDSICATIEFTLYTETEREMGLSFEWQEFSVNANDWISIQGAVDTSFNFLNGIASSTDYRLIASCANDSDTSDIYTMEIVSPSIDSLEIMDNGNLSYTFSPVNPKYIEEYAWDFGDGSTINTDSNPTYTYPAEGEYEITLVISNDCGEDTIRAVVNTSGVGIDEMHKNSSDITIYPNPASTALNIQSNDESQFQHFAIYDIIGRKIEEQESLHPVSEKIVINHLHSGIYFLKITLKNGAVISRKFEIIK